MVKNLLITQNEKMTNAMRLKNTLIFLFLSRGSILRWASICYLWKLTIATFTLTKTTVSVDF